MNQSKWENYVLCVCAIGGVMFVTPTAKVMAATHHPAMRIQQQLPQTKRIFQQISADGKINNRQITDVKWHQNSNGHFLVDSFQFPNINGYKDDTNWLKMGINRYETPEVPVVVYHLNYYSPTEKNQRINDGWIDMVDENGQVLERHVFTIPDGKGMEVELTPPEKMQFKQAQDARIYLHSSYRFKKAIVVAPKFQEEKPVRIDSQTPNSQEEHQSDSSTDTSDLLNLHDEGTNTESNNSVDVSTDTGGLIQQETKDEATSTEMKTSEDSSTLTEGLHDLIDALTETESCQPSTASEGTNTDLSSVQTADEGTSTEPLTSMSEESTDTDDLQPQVKFQDQSTSTADLSVVPELHESGRITDKVNVLDASTDTDGLNSQPSQKDEAVSTEELSKGLEASTDTDDLAGGVDVSTETNDSVQAMVTKNATTQTYFEATPVNGEKVSDDQNDLTTVFQQNPSRVKNNQLNQQDGFLVENKGSGMAPLHGGKIPTDQDLQNLAKENYPLSRTDKTPDSGDDVSNSRLPQTGNHASKMLIAIGVAIICLLGLFKPRGSQEK